MCSFVTTLPPLLRLHGEDAMPFAVGEGEGKSDFYRQGKSKRNPFLEPYQVTYIKGEPQQSSSDFVVYNLRLLTHLFSLYDRFHEAKDRNNNAYRGSKLSRGSKVHVIFSRYAWRHSLTNWRHNMEETSPQAGSDVMQCNGRGGRELPELRGCGGIGDRADEGFESGEFCLFFYGYTEWKTTTKKRAYA